MLRRWFGLGRSDDAAEVRALVAGWADGRARVGPDGRLHLAAPPGDDLAAKLRRAYGWITTRAILCDNPDLETGNPVMLTGEGGTVELRRRGGYASYVLLPLLGLVTSSRILFVGAPGRGKTSVATLMALLAGESLEQVRRGTQRGHPQLTVSDLLGSPLPGDLVRAQDISEIRVAFKGWLTGRVKIVDEFNRLPTKTQSALLSLMAEGVAEMYEQVVHTGTSAWYLTANDELGGGTFQVIDALRDRIDAVVRAVPFSPRHTGVLAARIEAGETPEEHLPDELIFTDEELARADAEIRALPVSDEALAALGTFASQVEFCRRASSRIEHMNKDTLHLAGRRLAHVCNEDCPLDKVENVCSQTESGISTRAQLSVIKLAKAFAWFRGAREATIDDLRLMLPWVMHERLRPAPHSGFFQHPEHAVLLSDRASWIQALFDRAVAHASRHADFRAPTRELEARTEEAARDGSEAELTEQMTRLERAMTSLLNQEMNGIVHEDLLRLRAAHARCRRRIIERRDEA